MAKKTPADLLAAANDQLKTAKIRVRIVTWTEGERLYLRATLPPKPDSGRSQAYQQRIPLGVYFNPAGIKRAEVEAQRLNYELMLNQFLWSAWIEDKEASKTVSNWVKAFEVDYFTKRERNPKSETTWDKDYRLPFKRLPQSSTLTINVLETTAATYPPDTRSRQRACTAYGALARFANLDDRSLKALRGKYRPTTVNRDKVPNDALILEWADRIPNEHWQNFYKLCACYGLRNHEVFYVDLEKLKVDPLAVVQDGKTGFHLALPCPLSWWEEWFQGQDIILPTLQIKRNQDYGNRSSHYFYELKMPFTIYDLRHAHAGRMEIKGIGGTIAARSQGHSLKTHSDIYLNFMGESELRQVLQQLR
ncbi:MAG: site-specific integrase [Cyanobacteria bacterium P01_D01_bin.56]